MTKQSLHISQSDYRKACASVDTTVWGIENFGMPANLEGVGRG
jgi:hypothetical protein